MEEKVKSFISKLSVDNLYTLLDYNKVLMMAISLGDKDLISVIIQDPKINIPTHLIKHIIRLFGLQKLKRLLNQKSTNYTLGIVLGTYFDTVSLHDIYPPNANKRILKYYLNVCKNATLFGLMYSRICAINTIY